MSEKSKLMQTIESLTEQLANDCDVELEEVLIAREILTEFFNESFKRALALAETGKKFKHFEYRSSGGRRVLKQDAVQLLKSFPDREKYFKIEEKLKTLPELEKLLTKETLNGLTEVQPFKSTLIYKRGA